MRIAKCTFCKCSLMIAQDHDLRTRFALNKSKRLSKKLLLRIKALQTENSYVYRDIRAEIIKHIEKSKTGVVLTRINMTPPDKLSVNAGMFEVGIASNTVPSDLSAHNLVRVFKECLALLEDTVSRLESGELIATANGFVPA